MSSTVIIDSGICNLDSITRAAQECGARVVVTGDVRVVERADRLIIPGVGAFGPAVNYLREIGLSDSIMRVAEQERPILGICLGMQLLADFSEEGEGARGLGLIPGKVKRMSPTNDTERVPHVGWNSITRKAKSALFSDIDVGTDFYFVHSYHFACDKENYALAYTSHCGSIVAAVGLGNIFGTQFHPEKSMRAGLKLLSNFLAL